MKSSVTRPLKGESISADLDDFVAIDIETTGLDPSYDKIIELSAIRYRNKEKTGVFSSLVNPHTEICDFIVQLTGITNDELRDAPDITDVLPVFLDFLSDDTLIAHNANFDVNFIYDNAETMGITVSNNFIDTLRLARHANLGLENNKLSALAEFFNITQNRKHRAEDDAEAAALIYQNLVEVLKSKNMDIDSLYDKNDYPQHTSSDCDPYLALTKLLGLTPKTFKEPKALFYEGIYSTERVPCSIVGIVSDHPKVVRVSIPGREVDIALDYLKDMQKSGFLRKGESLNE